MNAAGIAPALLVGHSLGGAAVLAVAGDLPSVEPDPDRVVQIALTSGTTGRSKLASLNGVASASPWTSATSTPPPSRRAP